MVEYMEIFVKPTIKVVLATYPPKPPSLTKGRGSVSKRGASPLSKSLPSPLNKGRGIKGEELLNSFPLRSRLSNYRLQSISDKALHLGVPYRYYALFLNIFTDV